MMVVSEQCQELWMRLHALREPWLELRLTAREDLPAGPGNKLADDFADAVDDGLGALDAAIAAAVPLTQERNSLREAGDALARIGEDVAAAARIHWRRLAAHDRQAQLERVGRRRGREWSAWVSGLQAALAPLPDRLEAAEAGLRAASHELVDGAAWAIDHPEGR